MIVLTASMCLAINVYKEARSASLQEQQSVAKVTIARSLNGNYCKAVFKPGSFAWTENRNKLKFSSYRAMLDYYNIRDEDSWTKAVGASILAIQTYGGKDEHILYYHDNSIKNFSWNNNKQLKVAMKTKNFTFYSLRS